MADITLVLAGSTGGIGTHVRSVVAGLCAHGHRARVLAPRSTHQLFDFAAVGAEPVVVPFDTGPEAIALLRAARVVRAQAGGDVVHAHGLRAGVVAGLALRGRPARPLVCTWHNALMSHGLRRSVDERLQRFAARSCDVTLGASADLVDQALRSGAIDARLGEVAAPRLAPSTGSRDETLAALGVDGPLVVCVARLHQQKRLDVLVEATRRLAARLRQVVVVVAGEGPERAKLEQLIARSGAPVRLLGQRADVADLLRAADAAVISSDWEARALVAQEALLAGAPLVTTAVGGIPELVGEAAQVVPARDPQALADALHRLLTDSVLAQRLRAAGQARAAAWPDEDEVVRRLEALYAELLGSRG